MRNSSTLRKVLSVVLMGANALMLNAQDYLTHRLATAWPADSVLNEVTVINTNESWWHCFDDALLDSLILMGRERNYDLAVAAKRIEISRAALRQVQSAYYPQLGLDLGWNQSRTSGRMVSSEGSASTSSYFNGGVSMSWELDVFGKITQQARKAKADVNVSKAEFDGAMISLDAQIATVYIGLLVSRAQLKVAQEHAQSQENILHITEVRYKTGLVSELDVTQAKTLYYSTISQIPLLEASIDASYNSLAVLLGTTRPGLPQSVFQDRPIPSHYEIPVLGVPMDLLRRRPDIVAAERQIDAAAAALGIAKSAYLPSLSIAANIGTAAHRFSDLFTGPSFTYSVAPTLSWTIFDGLSRRAVTVQARQTLESQVDNYNLTVLTALEEVRNAMSKYAAEIKYIKLIEQVVENSHKSVDLSLEQYKEGLVDFYNLVEAQLNYLTYQNNLMEAKGSALSALIDLYKALGGAYNQDNN